ncbi:MAG: efflux RND transporter permease subunit [Gammaproteobacteria bacterium]
MKLALFFIDRPIFAAVLSILTVVVGAIALAGLPVEQQPRITPPTVVINATYPGADARTVAQTVATPIEQQLNGVEDMLYLSSQSSNDGRLQIVVTFALGTDLDVAQMLVQNRVALAEPTLPEETRRIGITVRRSSPDMSMIINFVAREGTYDSVYLSNYVLINVRDRLARLPGVGDLTILGSRDYSMRVWLDPDLLAARGLAAGEVVAAIREQNVQVSSGAVGQPPTSSDARLQLIVRTQGRMLDAAQFADIIIKRGADGALVRLRDVARVELGAVSYQNFQYLGVADQQTYQFQGLEPTVGLAIFQRPGTNALETKAAVFAEMEAIAREFPPGLDYKIQYDTTVFVQESMRELQGVLIGAIGIVLVVVIVFLQTWRAALIPMLTVPVSLLGTCAVMAAAGYSLNTLTMMALVLAVGIVVDDAIVVVENVGRHMEEGMGARDATRTAMMEVSSPVIATAVVLSSVFVPTAFAAGVTGEFFRQFAVVVAAATIISAFNSLTLSPALAAILLQRPGERHDAFQRFLDRSFGWLFAGFNRVFDRLRARYRGASGHMVRRGGLVALVYGALLLATLGLFRALPSGFVPQADQGMFIVLVQLPDAANVQRTDEVMKRAGRMVLETPGVLGAAVIVGFSPLTRSAQANMGAMFCRLVPHRQRPGAGQSASAIAATLQKKLATIQDARIVVFQPPPVAGLGNFGGFKMQLLDRAEHGPAALQATADELIAKATADPRIARAFTLFRANVPQIYVDVDREQARQMNVPISAVNEALQIYLGSLYVNDFNRFGRTFRVTAQAEGGFRAHPENIQRLQVRNAEGRMVPLGSIVNVRQTAGPELVPRHNLYPTADVNGEAAPGVSSTEAMRVMEEVAERVLPSGYGIDWTELSYQQKAAGNTALFIIPLCVLFVFLALAAQYESWSLPLAVILIVPLGLLSAASGLLVSGIDNNVLTQVAFIVLIGLACKNAVLIVQFAKVLQDEGRDRWSAAVEAAQIRLRPILMTSFAFIFGVLPLVVASGAGAEGRRAIGTAVFSGMVGVTVFGLLLTPVFYVLMRAVIERRRLAAAASESAAG